MSFLSGTKIEWLQHNHVHINQTIKSKVRVGWVRSMKYCFYLWSFSGVQKYRKEHNVGWWHKMSVSWSHGSNGNQHRQIHRNTGAARDGCDGGFLSPLWPWLDPSIHIRLKNPRGTWWTHGTPADLGRQLVDNHWGGYTSLSCRISCLSAPVTLGGLRTAVICGIYIYIYIYDTEAHISTSHSQSYVDDS